MLNYKRGSPRLIDDSAKLIGIFFAIIVAIFAIATFYSLAATLSVDRAIIYLEDQGFTVFAQGETAIDLVDPGADNDTSGVTGSASGLEFILGKLTINRACSNDEILKWVESTDLWTCASDAGGAPTLVDPGTDADSTTVTGASGLEFISGALTILRGCDDNEFVRWNEALDTWHCNTIPIVTGSDGDSIITARDSGLEIIGNAVSIIRGCSNSQVLSWNETTDLWECTTSGGVDTGPLPDCVGTTTYQDGEGGCDTLDAGTDITADLEEETHATEHIDGGADELEGEDLATACTSNQFFRADGSLNIDCYTFVAAAITDLSGSTDITADLEEEAHCSEHSSADLTCSTETLIFAVDSVDFTELVQSNTLAGDPSFLVDECFFVAIATGGGFICEGSIADTAEQIYVFPDVNGSDTTSRIVVDNTEVTSVDGTGLTISVGELTADLGTSITTGEIVDDEILEVDLDAVDAAVDEECLTFETDNSGFEWQSCGSTSLLTTGSDGDSATNTNDSGLEFIGGDLTIIRGCNNNEVLKWIESTDTWNCALISLRNGGSDGDSTTTVTGSGLEFISGELTVIRGCATLEVIEWNEVTDTWDCSRPTPELRVGTDGDSTAATGASGLEFISDAITLLRGCDQDEFLRWDEVTDVWHCDTIPLRIGTDADSIITSSDSGLEIISNTITLIRGCSNNQILQWDEASDVWECVTFSSGTSVALDLLDDDSNESEALTEIAITGDTNSIFTEPIADKLLIALANNWPTSDFADALSADPTDCSANEATIGINAAGTAQGCNVLDGTGLTLSGSTLSADLGTSIETGEITDDEILEVDLDAVDTAVDEECLTFETDNSGFEWQSCGSTTLLTTGSDGDSVTVLNDSGLETIGGDLTIIRGCSDDQVLRWSESSDTWNCNLISLRDVGSDADSTTAATGSGLEFISGDLTLIRGCDDDEVLGWDEATDLWRCVTLEGDGLTVTGDILAADLGTEIVTGEIADDTILEADLDVIADTPADEECLTFESDAGGDFEWQSCGLISILTTGSEGDSVTVINDSGLETIGGDLSIIRGCSDNQILRWSESSDTWSCNLISLRDNGADADSTTTVTGSGLEYISGELTIIRGCSDNEILGWDEDADNWRCVQVAGTGITVTGDTFNVDLGIEIVTGEITDDTILEEDLDVIADTAADEECLTFESDAGGDFEWQSCGSTILTTGSDGDSATGTSDSGLEFIGSDLTLVRGCADNEVLKWIESTDTWNCSLTSLRDNGSDNDSTTTVTGSGLEFISGELTLIRGCADLEVLEWIESSDDWNCSRPTPELRSGTDGDSTTATGASGLEFISDALTILRGCDDDEFLKWDEDTDVWHCDVVPLRVGVDGDSNITTSDSGLEIIGRTLTLLRGCANEEVLEWVEATDLWTCAVPPGAAGGDPDQNLFETITDGSTSLVADSATDTITVATSGAAVSTIFDSGSDTFTIVVDSRFLLDDRSAVFTQANDVSTTMDIEDIRMYNFFGVTGTIQDAACSVGTAPTTSAVTVDINLNGTTIFTTQGNRPSIIAGNFLDVSGVPDVTAFTSQDYLQIEIDAEDSGDTAVDLTCQVRIRFRIYDTAS